WAADPPPRRTPCATRHAANTPSSRPTPPRVRPTRRRNGSFLWIPLPRLLVLGIIQRGLAQRVVDDAPALGDLRRVVRATHFVMKQFTARVAQQFLQLGSGIEQTSGAIQLPY